MTAPESLLGNAANASTAAREALRAEDFAIAIATHQGREHMLSSSRLMRQVCPRLFWHSLLTMTEG